MHGEAGGVYTCEDVCGHACVKERGPLFDKRGKRVCFCWQFKGQISSLFYKTFRNHIPTKQKLNLNDDIRLKTFKFKTVKTAVWSAVENIRYGRVIKPPITGYCVRFLMLRVFPFTPLRSAVEPISVVQVCLIASWLEHSAGHRRPCVSDKQSNGGLYFSTDFNEHVGKKDSRFHCFLLAPRRLLGC